MLKIPLNSVTLSPSRASVPTSLFKVMNVGVDRVPSDFPFQRPLTKLRSFDDFQVFRPVVVEHPESLNIPHVFDAGMRIQINLLERCESLPVTSQEVLDFISGDPKSINAGHYGMLLYWMLHRGSHLAGRGMITSLDVPSRLLPIGIRNWVVPYISSIRATGKFKFKYRNFSHRWPRGTQFVHLSHASGPYG